jgi:hypothetical protein
VWKEAMETELAGLHEYDTFEDMHRQLPGHKKMCTHYIFSLKHDLRHEDIMVTGGHLMEATHEGAYSGVILLQSMQICIYLAELNDLDIMVGDVDSAYLDALAKEKFDINCCKRHRQMDNNY